MQRATREADIPEFRLIVQNVCAWIEAGPAVAALRAGASGVLNLEGADGLQICADTVARAARLAESASGSLGFRLDANASWTEEVIALLPERTSLIVLTSADTARLTELRQKIQEHLNAEVLSEVTSEPQARAALEAGADGLIAKGHEAGGFVGEESTFVLLQRLLGITDKPVLACGGIGLHSAAACYAGGAAGIVLDSQLLLTPESSVPRWARSFLGRMSGDETLCAGNSIGRLCRFYKRPGTAAADAIVALENALAGSPAPDVLSRWTSEIGARLGWSSPELNVVPLGQDAVLARPLAERFGNVAGILRAFRDSVREHVTSARRQHALSPGAALAQAHGTEYPVLQGPMTRVSDTAQFAKAVADNGGLPFLALALLRGEQCRTLLRETAALCGDLPWGVGILGFVPADLRTEQLAVVSELKPKFAIIAGGRPDQSRHLEEIGIRAYLHVPAPALLRLYLQDGSRKFIFEGRECGGHVGPRTSFVLWDAMVEELLAAVAGGVKGEELHIIFAGGIHDQRSAAMVAALAAPLVEAGVKIGVLMGTAYLFTSEAVASGAIVDGFQQEAIHCESTVILDSGPGHSTRCVDTAFCDTFRETRRRLISENRSVEEIRDALENLNLGRLRIASKGITRVNGNPGERTVYGAVPDEQQRREGMYMIGQIAALRQDICTIRELHEQVTAGAMACLDAIVLPDKLPAARPARWTDKPCDVAIIGMGCLLPGAPDADSFWANILAKTDAIREVPRDRFDIDLYYENERQARDKVYSRWGGFIQDVAFDPMRYGIPPNALSSIDPLQLLMLVAVEQALGDAGYQRRSFDRDKASVIFGFSGGLGELGINYALRSNLPQFMHAPSGLAERLPEWTEDSFAGILPNVGTGRVANRLDLTGVNFTVDAACASSLAAIYVAARELATGSSDLVISGGVDTGQNPFGYLCFSKAQAISPRGRCSTFDQQADGIAISEGISVVVLKRLEDAERDGDKIYAVLKGIAGSSDGRGRSMTAPRLEGQVLALQRSYAQAGFPASSVGLIEAHGTGTVAGDSTEVAALTHVFRAEGAAPQSCSLGSVKSMVGHTKAAAGVTGLMKAALALHHRVLPPTLHVEQPNPRLQEPDTPFFLTTEAQPWLTDGTSRRAGVSSFGFGGTNFHAVLEEYTGAVTNPADQAVSAAWPSELFVWSAASAQVLSEQLTAAERAIAGSEAPLREIAAAVCGTGEIRTGARLRLALVASSRDALLKNITAARSAIASGTTELQDPAAGLYLSSREAPGAVAFLFPGQGSQSPGMLRDLAVHFSEFRDVLALADSVFDSRYGRRFSSFLYPPAAFSAEEKNRQMQAITDTAVAQPALGVVDTAACALLNRLGVRPDMTAGHSYGEYAALCAAGVFDAGVLLRISEERGRAIRESLDGDAGAMAAITADAAKTAEVLAGCDGVTIANYNSPRQTIVAGPTKAVESAMQKADAAGLFVRRLPVACAFHTSLMEGAAARLGTYLAAQSFSSPRFPVFSNTLASRYPEDPAAIRELLTQHLTSPVRFDEEIRAMYDNGARIFVESGPRAVLTGLARTILEGRDAQFIQIDSQDRDTLSQLLHALAQLWAAGIRIETAELFQGRVHTAVTMADIAARVPRSTGWMLNPARVYRAGQKPEIAPPIVPAPAAVAEKPALPAPAPVYIAPPVMAQVPAPSSAAPADTVILQFQELMSQFLQAQTAVMSSYLGGAVPVPAVPPALSMPAPVLPPAPVQTAVPVPLPPAPVAELPPAPVAAPAIDIQERLLAVVSERTGYPLEMLDQDAAIEADLGIDSIKRVEILGTFRRSFPEPEQTVLRGVMESLTSSKTLREMVDRLSGVLATKAPAPQPVAAAAPVAAPAINIQERLLAVVSERTGYPLEMLDQDAAIEADLGIDSIKRVEILGTFRRSFPEPEQTALRGVMESLTSSKTLREMVDRLSGVLATKAPAPQPVAAAAPVAAPAINIQERLLAVVSERTGYPVEMLDQDAAIEADLGIDSIKRVEILGTFRRSFPEPEQTALRGVMESLTSSKTLREMVDRLSGVLATKAPAPQPVAAAAPAEVPVRDIAADLLAMVSSRTGYPVDMLDQDAAIEADLGIDSIKRVEIVGAFRRSLSAPEQSLVANVTETLTAARTLREMIGLLSAALSRSAAPAPATAAVQVPLFRLTPVPAHIRRSAARFYPGRVTVLTDDETGLASAVASGLLSHGERPVLLRHSPDLTVTAEGVVATDLTDAAAVESAVNGIRNEYGPIGAILHFLPMRAVQPWKELDTNTWRTQIRLDVTSLYALAKAAEQDLQKLGTAKGAMLVAVTGRGGEFGLEPDSTVQPGHHGVADFVKTLSLEFENVACKVVDVDPSDSPAILYAKLFEELTAGDATLQVGLPGDRRLSVKPQILPKVSPSVSEPVTRDWVFVLTGGARGITAAIAATIARRYQPVMVLIGASSLPASEEPADIAGVTDPGAIRSALLARLRAERGSRPVKPVEVEAAYGRVMKDREILHTLAELREAGARAEYQAVNVRDDAGFTAAIEGIYARYGRLDVFIHGAGVIEDKLIRHKTPDSFDRVVHTKADSSFVLARSLRMESLQRLIFMSSITAALGNRGQADYAAANGIMNGIAICLAGLHSGRVVSFNWGPWDQAGMVSDTVREQFLSRGVQLIPIGDGADCVLKAIEFSAAESPLVVVGDGPWTATALPASEQKPHSRTVGSGA